MTIHQGLKYPATYQLGDLFRSRQSAEEELIFGREKLPLAVMSASGGDGRTNLAPPTAALTGDDIVLDLQSQLASTRKRVEELERTNEILLSRLSRCRCSQEEDSRARLHNELYTAEIGEPATSFTSEFSDLSIICSSNPFKLEVDRPANVLNENCANLVKHKLREESGCHMRSIHHHAKRYVALKIMYFGRRFYGFASEAQMDPTIESEIFKALKRTRLLIGNKEDSHYSRCGRTDKGVSSTGQVISLYLRSNLKEVGENTKDKIFLTGKSEEIDYVRVLNRELPSDIRVIGWCPARTDFHARFSCLSREYKYLFWRGSLDIVDMQNAAQKFIGEHDFRNFCKMDAANVSNYRRQITSFQISSCNQRSNDDELWAITIRGSAFLWHQVRCMVAVLFMIGLGLESSDLLDLLLDTRKTPRKPQYNMAPELPLILRCCEFEDLNFFCSSDSRRALHEHLKNEFQTYMLQAAIFYEAMCCLSMPTGPFEPSKKKKSHIPLMRRPTEPSHEEQLARLKTKASNKSQPNQTHK